MTRKALLQKRVKKKI